MEQKKGLMRRRGYEWPSWQPYQDLSTDGNSLDIFNRLNWYYEMVSGFARSLLYLPLQGLSQGPWK